MTHALIRAERAADRARRSELFTEPRSVAWWHSLSCTCELCLDADAYACCSQWFRIDTLGKPLFARGA